MFMDVNEDSYFMLEPTEERAFLELVNGRPAAATLPREFAPPGGPEGLRIEPVRCARPHRSALERHHEGRGSTLADLLAIWRSTLQARSELRRQPIGKILAGLGRSATARREPLGASNPAVLAMRFAAARRLVPIAMNCLTDSLALLRWLAAYGSGATLVFGVKLDPFAAHCWAQRDGLLLNDHPERVERFTPVRTIECTPGTP